jgi:hypothetical protein
MMPSVLGMLTVYAGLERLVLEGEAHPWERSR